jgi:hypothetical protein
MAPPPSVLPRHFSRAWNSSRVEVPVGAPADVLELEYCSALRQAAPDMATLRENGSLTANDIRVHLLSRHSVRVPIKDIEEKVLVELAGGATYPVPVPRGTGPSSSSSSVHGWKAIPDGDAAAAASAKKPNGRGHHHHTPNGNLTSDDDKADTLIPPTSAHPMLQEPSKMVINKTTPLDLVQQTALLLIPELHKFRVESSGTLSRGPELVQHEADLEPEAPSLSSPPPPGVGAGGDRRGSDPAGRSAPAVPVDGDPSSAPGLDAGVTIEGALLLICEQAGIEYGVELTFGVMRDILHAFSEDHWDDETVEQMVRAAGAPSTNGTLTAVPVLDAGTFLRALTSDLTRYRSEWSGSASTHLQDVNSNEHVSDVGLPPPPLESFYSLPSIDYTAETYSNYLWTVLSWFLFMITFGSYLIEKFSNLLGGGIACDATILTPFGCRVVRSSFVWLEVFVKVRAPLEGQRSLALPSRD